MKKNKSHARHVFSFLEKNYGITFVFAEEEDKKSNKKSSNNKEDRRSTISKNKQNDLMDYSQARNTNSCLVDL